MPRSRQIPPVVRIASLAIAVSAVAACADTKTLFGPDLADPARNRPVSYRALSDIPKKPELPPEEMREGAVQALTADRAATAQAADRLRNESFKPPEPPPPLGQVFQ
jgi:hypothetical protein